MLLMLLLFVFLLLLLLLLLLILLLTLLWWLWLFSCTRSLRKTALADHGRFDQYHHVFRNFFENEILHFHDHDNNISGKGGNKADFVSLNLANGLGTTMPGVDEQSSVSGSLASFEANLAAVGLTRPDATPPKQDSLPPPPEMNDDEINELREKLREMLLPIEDTQGVFEQQHTFVIHHLT